MRRMKNYNLACVLKKMLDFLFAATGILLISPLLTIIAFLVLFFHGRPILFRQIRPGLHQMPFEIYKFRTLIDKRGPNGDLLPDEQRLTRFGKFLRRTSLDELPELFNVLKGDMSLVGPRPLLMEYLELYSSEQARRHEMRPGITGWAQVNGRNAISWEEKFKHDLWYIDHWSLFLDLKIIFMTIVNILKMEGINQPGQATAEKFKGEGS